MKNEMGNQNASGIKEEEKIAAEVLEKPQEAAHEDAVKGENNIIPKVQTKDFLEKASELSSDDLPVTNDSNAERYESDEKEEEKATAEVPEKPQEAAHEDVVKGENNIIPDVLHTKDFHEKASELSSDDLSVTNDSNAERHESDEKEQGNKESEPPSRYLEAATESYHPVSQENYVEKTDSPYEVNYEKPLDSNLEEIMPINDKIQSNDHPSIRRETDAGEVENTNSNSDSKNTFQDSKTVDATTTPLEERRSLSSQESVEVLKLSVSCHVEENQNNGNEINREGNRDDLVLEQSPCIEDESLEMNIFCIEQCDSKGIKERVQHGHGNDGDIQLPLKENLNDVSSSPTETVPEISPIDPSSGSPELQVKHIVHAEEINLTYDGSENPEKEPNSDRAQFSEQTVNQLSGNASPPMIEHEACSKENGEENMIKMSSSSDLQKLYQAEGTNVIHTATEQEQEQEQEQFRDKNVVVMMPETFSATEQEQEQFRDKNVVVMMPETFSVSNGLTSIDKYDEGEKATEKLLVEETEKRNDGSSSTRNSRHNAGTAEESMSSIQLLEGETYLVPVSPTSPFNSENCLDSDSLTSSFNHQWSNGFCSEAAEDWNKCTVNLEQYSSCDVFIAEVSTFNAQKASMQTLNPCGALEEKNHVHELEQNVQSNSGIEADYKKHIIGETSPLPSYKAQKSAAGVSIESNSDHPVTRVKLRKSPSFEFGVPLDARSEESDQTPLLVRDKSLAGNFSGHANVRFQNTMIAADYGRNSLDYEPVSVEEKTIRMERSDSDASRDSFMSLLRKDVKQSVEITSEKKESHVAEKAVLESPSEELALTSGKTSGKRKPRSSLFSACICCTAAIH